MSGGSGGDRPVWAKWRVVEDGRIEVVATYREGDGYVQRERSYPDVEAAGAELGSSFTDVVRRVADEGRSAGRWRP